MFVLRVDYLKIFIMVETIQGGSLHLTFLSTNLTTYRRVIKLKIRYFTCHLC